MGAPKGKPHRKFTPKEKLRYITELQESHISQSRFAKEQGINISILKRWMKDYAEQGEEGLASNRNRCGNRYTAPPEIGCCMYLLRMPEMSSCFFALGAVESSRTLTG